MRDISLLPQYTTVTCQTMCPGGSFYSACTESGLISVWEVDSLLSNSPPKPLLSFAAHGQEPIYSLTSTENFLISGGLGEVRGWCWNGFKTKTEKPAWSFHVGATGRSTQINWIDLELQAGSSGRVYVGCSDGNIYIYDLETRRLDKVLTGHTQFVHCVAGADGSGGVSLISGGEDGDVKLWDTRKSNPLIHSFSPYLESELNRPECGRFISTVCTAGDWLVCGGGPAASLWNLSTRIMSSRLPPDHGAVFASNLIEDQIYIAGQNPMLHMEKQFRWRDMFCGESELWMYLQYSSAGGERNNTYCWILINHRYLLIEEPGRSGNVVKNAELLQHLGYLEMRADNGGFTCLEFTKLSSVLVERHMPAQISRRFVNCLVPNQPVQGKFLVDLILWALGDFVDISKYVASSFLQIVNLCLENDLVKGRAPLSHVYELLLSRLENQTNSNTIIAILVKITKKVDVDDRRVKFFRKISKNIGLGNNVSALLWRFRQLRPDLEPSCPPTVGKSTANTILHKRFRRISDAGVEKVLSGLGWEPGQLATKVILKDRLKQTLLPSAETLNLEGGLQSKRNSKIPLQCIESTEDLENVELPNNILSVLGCKAACNILPRKELIERFCLVLYHTLSKEFSSLPTPRSKSERERRDKRQRRFLRILMEFQIHCFQGIPVVGRFLHEFLIDWDGEQFFDEILGLIKVCQITEFKEIYDTILSQVEQHFHVYTLIDKLLVLDAYFELLKFWSAVEYKRLIEMKDGLFLDSSTNCENPLSSIIDLSAHIGELVETALASARSEHSPDQSLFSHFITEKYIVAQEVMLRFEVAVRLILPQPFYHEALFSFSYLSISQVAKYVLTQKKRVIPLLKERGAYLETMGDSKSAKIIRNQLSLDQLIRGFDSSIADMLLVLSPTSVYQRSDSLLRMGWTVDEDYILDRLFISKHPAFLSLTIKYFSELGLNKSEVQDIWKGLTVDRIVCENSDACFYSEFNQSKAPNTFYKSKASNMVAVSNPHLDQFLNYITENVPVVGEFIQVFCQPSKLATSVITTTTMDSGISSYQPSKAKKNHVLKSKRTDENRRSSPRVTVARNNEKRKSDTTPNDLSKRTVLTELN